MRDIVLMYVLVSCRFDNDLGMAKMGDYPKL